MERFNLQLVGIIISSTELTQYYKYNFIQACDLIPKKIEATYVQEFCEINTNKD